MTQNTHDTHNPIRMEVKHHSNGAVKSKTPYIGETKHGMVTVWHDNGAKATERVWVNNRLHGTVTFWGDNGQKQETAVWRCNKLQGLATGWRKNGTKKWEKMWVNGVQQGSLMEWDQEGNVTTAKFPTIPSKKQNYSTNQKTYRTKSNQSYVLNWNVFLTPCQKKY